MAIDVTFESRIILDTLNKLEEVSKYTTGSYHLIEYLINGTGRISKKFSENKGSLKNNLRPIVQQIINNLIKNNYIEQHEFKKADSVFYTLHITEEGKKVLEDTDKKFEIDFTNITFSKAATDIYMLDINRMKAIKKYYFKNFLPMSAFCAVQFNNAEDTKSYLHAISNNNTNLKESIAKESDNIIKNIDFSVGPTYSNIATVPDGNIYDLIILNKEFILNELNHYTKYRNITEMFRFVIATLKIYVPKSIQEEFINKIYNYLIANNHLKSQTEIGEVPFTGLVVTTRQSYDFNNTTVELSTAGQREIISKIEDIMKV